MRGLKLILVSHLLAIPAFAGAGSLELDGREPDIRQERYSFRMSVTRDVNREAFVIGAFPPRKELAPPSRPAVGRPMLSIRVSSSSPDQVEAQGQGPIPAAPCAMPTLLFYFNDPSPAAFDRLEIVSALAGCGISPGARIPLTVTGFTCDLGDRNFNQVLAQRRAGNVASLLSELGFTVAETHGVAGRRGDYDPVNRHLARRVEIRKFKEGN